MISTCYLLKCLVVTLFCVSGKASMLDVKASTVLSGDTEKDKIELVIPEIHTYEDYVALLSREAKIPLDRVAEEQNREILDDFIGMNRKLFRNDAEAFRACRENLYRERDASTIRAAGLIEYYHLKSARAEDMAVVFRQIAEQKLALINEIGKTNFIERYAAIFPRLNHLSMLEEYRLKECMDEQDHREYFVQEIHSRIQPREVTDGEQCSCGCIFRILPPETRYGDFNYALSKTVKYPIIAQERNIQGKVWVSYIVGVDGNVSSVVLLRSAAAVLDKEAMRAIGSMTFARPAYCPEHKCNVALRFVAPVNFVLQ